MEIIVMIIMFLVISSGGVLGAVFLQKKYEETLPLMQCILIMILFLGRNGEFIKGECVDCMFVNYYGIWHMYLLDNKK